MRSPTPNTARSPACSSLADEVTSGGTALRAPGKLAGMLAGLLPPATRWRLFFDREAANPRYLHDGDVVTATIASPDGQLDVGTQRNTVIGKTP